MYILSFLIISIYLVSHLKYFTLDAASPIIFKYSSIVAGIDNALGYRSANA